MRSRDPAASSPTIPAVIQDGIRVTDTSDVTADELTSSYLPRGSRAAIGRTATQFMLIVVSVTAALVGHGVWATREERRREHVYVEQLVIDLDEMERRLARALSEEQAAGQVTLSLLSHLNDGIPVPEDSLLAWFTPPRWPFWYSDPRAVMGTVTALQHTGDLHFIGDDSLRVAVSAYSSDMSAEWDEFGRWVNLGVHWMTEFYTQGSMVTPDYPVGESEADRSRRGATFFRAMENERYLQAIMNNLQNGRRNRIFYLHRMRDATDNLRHAIERAE